MIRPGIGRHCTGSVSLVLFSLSWQVARNSEQIDIIDFKALWRLSHTPRPLCLSCTRGSFFLFRARMPLKN